MLQILSHRVQRLSPTGGATHPGQQQTGVLAALSGHHLQPSLPVYPDHDAAGAGGLLPLEASLVSGEGQNGVWGVKDAGS